MAVLLEDPPCSGVLLAGGRSRRMGRDKARLPFRGMTLLEHQVDKLRRAGVGEILLSGSGHPALPGTRSVPDVLPDRGPLGGLHACLQAASSPRCLVLSVDVPLIPVEILRQLCRSHQGGVTVLRHGGRVEPLIGVYDSALAPELFALIAEGGAPVRALQERVAWHCLDYHGDERLLCNCNTPEEFAEMERIAAALP